MNVIKLMRISLFPGLLRKDLLHLLPHWIISTQSPLSYLISLRSALHPPTYIQNLEGSHVKFHKNFSFSSILLVHVLLSPCKGWLCVHTMELFITYFFQFIYSKWLKYFIHLATYMLSESFLGATRCSPEVMHTFLLWLYKSCCCNPAGGGRNGWPWAWREPPGASACRLKCSFCKWLFWYW